MRDVYDLGLLLRELRRRAGLSQKELGERINRDKGVISRYESNLQTPPFETMRELAVIFNVSMDYLAGFESGSAIHTYGLDEIQRELLNDLAELFRAQNKKQTARRSSEQYELLGRVAERLLKK